MLGWDMKKLVVFMLIFIMLVVPMVLAAENVSESDNPIEKAYNCLDDRVKDRTDLSLQEAIFTTLAAGYKENVVKIIEDGKKENDEGDCWPKDNCKIKETSQVLLAYERIGRNTDKIVEWLLSKNATSVDLVWNLEIDSANHVPMSCTITYDGQDKSINIGDDMKISGNPGSCLEIASKGYWVKVRNNCLDREFKVSCEEDFITTLIYQKGTGGTIYVSSNTNSAPSLGTTNEKVEAQCFKTTGACDYEGSLWAVLALSKIGEDIEDYLPYLLALAEDNERYFPSTIIYALTSGNNLYAKIINEQKQGRYWQQPSTPYNRYYDTGLAMLALSSSAASEFTDAQDYLLEIQTEAGCWNNNNIRDTAFVLYGGWQKNVPSSRATSGGGIAQCSTPRSCERASACEDADLEVLMGYDCPSIYEVCCSEEVVEQLCVELGGLECSAGQQCSGEIVSSSDGPCCKGSCQDISQETCQRIAGGICRLTCSSDEEEKYGEICESSIDVCCIRATTSEGDTNWWLWIIILLILIVLVGLGIVYRKKIQMWWHSRKSGRNQRGPGGPGMPPAGGGMFRGPLVGSPGVGRPPMGRPMPGMGAPRGGIMRGADKAMEDTMAKLKAIGGGK